MSGMEFFLQTKVVVAILFLDDNEETEAQRDDVTCLQITQLVRGGAKVLS